jgi:hypothetical protein
VFNLALNGYYDNNYMFRVITGKYVQFGTAGDPTISNLYNYTSGAADLQSSCGVFVALTATVGMVGAVATVAVIAAVVMAAMAVVTLVAVAATAKCTSIRRARVCQGSPTRSGHCP